MFETLSHTLGFCGEPHPSLLWLIGSAGTMLYVLKHNVKWCWKKGCDYCKHAVRKRIK